MGLALAIMEHGDTILLVESSNERWRAIAPPAREQI